MPIICGQEHESIPGNLQPYSEWLRKKNKWYKAEILGLYEKSGGYALGNFIGVVWIGDGNNRSVLQGNSKFSEMDYIKMYAECAADATVGEYMRDCLEFWTEQKLIKVPDDLDFLLLSAIAYLRELNELCCRHLRRHFLRERKNFVGKVKGKILIGENLRQNIVRQRPDRIFSEYQSVSDDILENRILRAALERAARCIAGHSSKTEYNLELPQQWIRACRAHLQGVSVTQIKRTDFNATRQRGSFTHYRRPLALAKTVLLQLGFNPHQDIPQTKTQTQTPPFALNSAKLFERFAELKLRQSGKFANFSAPRKKISGNYRDFDIPVHPDFYVKNDGDQEPQIIDAKYKKISSTDDIKNADFYQVIAYSQHRRIRKEMECDEDKKVQVALAYPSMDKHKKLFFEEAKTNAFLEDFRIYRIPCPTKPVSTS